MQRAGKATLCCLYWPDHGIRPGEQRWPFQDPGQDQLSSYPTQYHEVLSWKHERNSFVRSATSDPFNILSGVKQGCVLAPTLFGIFFVTLLKHAFGKSTEGVYLRTKSGGNLFKLSRLRDKTRVHEKYVRDLLFANDAAITTHTQEDLQRLLDRFSEVCRHYGLTIRLAKTHVMGQDKTLRWYHRSSFTLRN